MNEDNTLRRLRRSSFSDVRAALVLHNQEIMEDPSYNELTRGLEILQAHGWTSQEYINEVDVRGLRMKDD